MFFSVASARSVLCLGAWGLLAFLSACGGGADGPTVAAPVPAVVAPSNPSAGTDAPGQLNYLVYRVNRGTHESVAVPATVTYANPNGTLSLALSPADLSVTTSNNWASVTWPESFEGLLAFNGNVICVSGLAGTNQVGLSHNMVRVTNVDELKGKSFTFHACTEVPGLSTIHPDGTMTGDGELVSASVVAELFSEAGLTYADGGNWKWIPYKIALNGQTRYVVVIVFIDRENGKNKRDVRLLVQN